MLLKPGISAASGVFGSADALSEVTLYSQDTGTSSLLINNANAPNVYGGYSFVASQDALCNVVEFYLGRSAATGLQTFHLQADAAGVPSGTTLTTWTIDVTTLPSSPIASTKHTLTSSGANVTGGNTYWIVTTAAALIATGSVAGLYSTASIASTQTKYSSDTGSTWGTDNTSVNLRFIVKGLV